MNLLKRIGSALKSFFRSDRAAQIAGDILTIAEKVEPLVQMIAAVTPTRADDEIVALFQRYAVPGVRNWLSLPPDQRGAALLTAATTEAARLFPGTPTSILQAAIQLALVNSRH